MAFLSPPESGRMLPVARLLRAGLALVTGWLALAGTTGRAQPAASPEYQVKALFLFNFAQFVEWPSQTLGADQTPLVIGVLGEDPFGKYLDDAVQGERIGSHPLVARRFRRVEDITACHILFISRSEAGRFAGMVPRLRALGVLTVADFDSFIRQGGMIGFVTVNNKIRLKINLVAAKAAGLTISSKLLRPALVVVREPN
jgi:hypothetical protein